MILILSNSTDVSTCEVIDWLNYFNAKWFRINECTKIEILRIDFEKDALKTFIIKADGIEINLKKVKTFWYRRGWLNVSNHYPKKVGNIDTDLKSGILEHLNVELENVVNLIHQYLGTLIVNINSFLLSKNDKMFYLLKPAEAGLSIPDTLICTDKQVLNEFRIKHKKIITKSINEGFMFTTSENVYFATTEIVDDTITLFYNNCWKMTIKLSENDNFFLNNSLTFTSEF